MRGDEERHLWIWYAPYGLGGVETYLLNMVRETIRDGCQVWVAATKNADGPLRERFADTGATLLDWSDFHWAYMSRRPQPPVRTHIASDIARIRPTLLALNDCNDFSMGFAPLLRQVRSYCTIIDTLHIDSPVDQYLQFRREFVDVLDGIAGTNQNVVERFLARYSESAVAARYIANGVAVPQRERKPFGDTLRLLLVGRLAHDQKRILELPRLLALLRDRGRLFNMTIAGDGPCRQQLAADIQRRGLDDQVKLAGYLEPDDVLELYFTHDVLVNLSTFEGFSMSVLEAFAAGCVPVCTDVASLDRTVFQDGVNCMLCPVEHLDRMVDIWSELTPSVLERLSEQARAIGRRFTANRTYSEYKALVRELRDLRPLERWPHSAHLTMELEWDLTKPNPWLIRSHPLRQLASSTWVRLKRSLSAARS
ncbi:MAG TPA: glycosyltransferase family 4 protein [Blastocatellia bacterium]|nr:glycosyltransferase family 4 protein [Blastocatellia bacterium]